MTILTVRGMSCGPCARAVTGAIQRVDPDANVDIDLATKRVEIVSSAKVEEIAASIEAAGYRVE
ncbi:heavy-metal-associated domain-containing protein [Sphingomonas edaphi]|uniref:Copper chaperone n=1 Tax=Sphingomonas edaphi TaxID=2315689 RepID=A0A418PZ58_9SPHN|nr:heavy-metal-associated domain-containing protein [Sphingomonas edaphi]RIX27443.1 copper chaperone [Sphingomonas edaphi]